VIVRFFNIGGIADHDCLSFLFISIYKYNANTNKNYIYSRLHAYKTNNFISMF